MKGSENQIPETKHNVELTQNEIELIVTSLMTTILDCGMRMQRKETDPVEKMVCVIVGEQAIQTLKKLEKFLPEEKSASVGLN